MARRRVVILGGGFGGLSVARRLAKSSARRADFDITIIDAERAQAYTPWMYEVAGGVLRGGDGGTLVKAAGIAFGLVRSVNHVRVRHARVVGVDVSTRHVLLDDGMTIAYDDLVVALGAEVNYFGIEGLEEVALPVKRLADADRVRLAIDRALEGRVTGKGRPVRIVVCGAGPTGVELAAELMVSLRAAEKLGRFPNHAAHVTLIDRGERVLPMSSPAASRRIARRLGMLGVECRMGYAISRAQRGALFVKEVRENGHLNETEELLPFDVCVWSGGVRVNRVVEQLPFARDARGRIMVDRMFRVAEVENVYALGDCAVIGTTPDPQTAAAAVRQAEAVARNIERAQQKRSLLPYHTLPVWPMLIAVGGKYGVGSVGPLAFGGYLMYVLRRLIDLRYFAHVMPWPIAWRLWRTGVVRYEENEAGI